MKTRTPSFFLTVLLFVSIAGCVCLGQNHTNRVAIDNVMSVEFPGSVSYEPTGSTSVWQSELDTFRFMVIRTALDSTLLKLSQFISKETLPSFYDQFVKEFTDRGFTVHDRRTYELNGLSHHEYYAKKDGLESKYVVTFYDGVSYTQACALIEAGGDLKNAVVEKYFASAEYRTSTDKLPKSITSQEMLQNVANLAGPALVVFAVVGLLVLIGIVVLIIVLVRRRNRRERI